MRRLPAVIVVAALLFLGAAARADGPADWVREFPNTDFSRTAIDLREIRFDGPRRDTIPAIDNPKFLPVAAATQIGPLEPVLSLRIGGEARAYPLRVLLWHEIVNDTVGGTPVLVTYCPLCNSAVVFDRRLDGRVLSFANTGRIRHFDMVMYDRQTESWWQQFTGEAIVGALVGKRLKLVPARLESLARFRARAPRGMILIPNDRRARPYGTTPYVGMERRNLARGLYPVALPRGVRPLERVVVVGGEAWTLAMLRRRGTIRRGALVIRWIAGQNSIHDARTIAQGRDVGNVVVQRRTAAGLVDLPYDVAFAFAFKAFRPDGRLNFQ